MFIWSMRGRASGAPASSQVGAEIGEVGGNGCFSWALGNAARPGSKEGSPYRPGLEDNIG